MDLKTRYVVKGINKEQIMDSRVKIHTEGDKISRVEDWWGGELNDGPIKNVSRPLLDWGYTSRERNVAEWSLTVVMQAFRRLNAVSMPLAVSVPKNAEEDKARGN